MSTSSRPSHRLREVGLATSLTMALLAGGTAPLAGFDALPREDPASHGVDGAALEGALANALDLSYLYGMVVVRDGVVVGERYRNDAPDRLRHVRSVTKSVTSVLVGIAIDRGFLPGPSARMVDYLPPGLNPSDARADRITIEDLLTMRSGLRFDENLEWNAWLGSSNQAAFVLSRSLEAEPGTRVEYNTAAVHILSLILEQATGMTELDFADRELFAPLGITERRWEADRQGHSFGGHGLQLRVEDIAKLGLLVARRGRWGTTRIVSSEWIAASIDIQVDLNAASYGPLGDIDYGYLWWLDHSTPSPIAIAWGWGGQFAVVMPAEDLVVAAASRWQVQAAQANVQESAVLSVIIEQVLPAVGPRRVTHRRANGRVSGDPNDPPLPTPILSPRAPRAPQCNPSAAVAGAAPAAVVSSDCPAAVPRATR